MDDKHLEVDVVVLGSSAGGLSAAVVAARVGSEVLLLEKEPVLGGSTAISGGVAWIPCNPAMSEVGMTDSEAAAKTYLSQVLGNALRHDLVDAFLENGPRRRYLKAGYLRRGAAVAELARAIGMPEQALEDKVARHNRYAMEGHDPDFGKGGNPYDLHQGDPRNLPNPCLAPIDRAPFHAVAVYPGDIGSTRGLVTDGRARVLDAVGEPIPGLYACGNDMNSVMSGTYPGAGITLGSALTFGYIAGCQLGAATATAEGTRELEWHI